MSFQGAVKQCGACAMTGLVFDAAAELQACVECGATGWLEFDDNGTQIAAVPRPHPALRGVSTEQDG